MGLSADWTCKPRYHRMCMEYTIVHAFTDTNTIFYEKASNYAHRVKVKVLHAPCNKGRLLIIRANSLEATAPL